MSRGKGNQHSLKFEAKRERRTIEWKLLLLSLIAKQGERLGNEIYTTGIRRFERLYDIPHYVIEDLRKTGVIVFLGSLRQIKDEKIREICRKGLFQCSPEPRRLAWKLKSCKIGVSILECQEKELRKKLSQIRKGGSP